MIWEEDDDELFGKIHVLQGRMSLATVREDPRLSHTVVTVSILLPVGEIDQGKREAESMMSKVMELERKRG